MGLKDHTNSYDPLNPYFCTLNPTSPPSDQPIFRTLSSTPQFISKLLQKLYPRTFCILYSHLAWNLLPATFNKSDFEHYLWQQRSDFVDDNIDQCYRGRELNADFSPTHFTHNQTLPVDILLDVSAMGKPPKLLKFTLDKEEIKLQYKPILKMMVTTIA